MQLEWNDIYNASYIVPCYLYKSKSFFPYCLPYVTIIILSFINIPLCIVGRFPINEEEILFLCLHLGYKYYILFCLFVKSFFIFFLKREYNTRVIAYVLTRCNCELYIFYSFFSESQKFFLFSFYL